jgi:putative membrane protein
VILFGSINGGNMKKIFSLGLLTAVSALGLAGCGDTATNTAKSTTNSVTNTVTSAVNTVANTAANVTKSNSPEDFVKDAAQGGMAEVELGQLALKNSQNADVKKFGQMMIDDHGKANTELKALAGKKNITLPSDEGPHKSTKERLSGLNGPAFDKAYVDAMMTDHNNDIKDFEYQANSGTDPDVKAFAAKTLPTLKKHLQAIEAVRDKMLKQ